MMADERPAGYYWVKVDDKWIVSRWSGVFWYDSEDIDRMDCHADDEYEEIGERVMTPEEIEKLVDSEVQDAIWDQQEIMERIDHER